MREWSWRALRRGAQREFQLRAPVPGVAAAGAAARRHISHITARQSDLLPPAPQGLGHGSGRQSCLFERADIEPGDGVETVDHRESGGPPWCQAAPDRGGAPTRHGPSTPGADGGLRIRGGCMAGSSHGGGGRAPELPPAAFPAAGRPGHAVGATSGSGVRAAATTLPYASEVSSMMSCPQSGTAAPPVYRPPRAPPRLAAGRRPRAAGTYAASAASPAAPARPARCPGRGGPRCGAAPPGRPAARSTTSARPRRRVREAGGPVAAADPSRSGSRDRRPARSGCAAVPAK